VSGSVEVSQSEDPPLRPLPWPDELTEGYWAAVRAHRLSIQRCAECRRWNHAPSLSCPACGSEKLAFEPVSGRAKVHSWTVLHNSPGPGFRDLLPLIVGIVELDEQERLLMTTNLLNVEADRLSLGMPVEVTYETLADGYVLPQFQPVS